MFKHCDSVGCCDKNCIDWALLLIRLSAGVIFLLTGFGKLFGTPGIEGFSGMLTGIGFPLPNLFAYLVGIIELLGGISLIIGYGIRFFAPLLAIIMVVAFITVKKGLPDGNIDLALFSILIALSLTGPGLYAVGGKRRNGMGAGGDRKKACGCDEGKCMCGGEKEHENGKKEE